MLIPAVLFRTLSELFLLPLPERAAFQPQSL